MSNKFQRAKEAGQLAAGRPAIPQIDPESSKPVMPAATVPATPAANSVTATPPAAPNSPTYRLTAVDTSETPSSRSFQMYPSRHRQLARDLAYIEDRHPWQIMDDALEEYVVKRYGRGYKRK